YLALGEGPKTQRQLIGSLGFTQPKISRVCERLLKLGFIESTRVSGKQLIYHWTDFEKLLQLSRLARTVQKEQEAGKVQTEEALADAKEESVSSSKDDGKHEAALMPDFDNVDEDDEQSGAA